MKSPKLRLNNPANPRKAKFARLKRAAVNRAGSANRVLIIIMPPIEPAPNTAMYKSASDGEEIVANTINIKAALPAIP